MKTLKFAHDLVPLVLKGEKTTTWRLFDDKDLHEGEKVAFLNKNSGEKFATAELVKVWEKELGALTSEEKKGHETFLSDEAMYAAYKKYYNREVGPQTSVKIIRFKLLQ